MHHRSMLKEIPRTISPEELREYRRQLGLTQHQLAQLLGVSQSAVTLWEQGKRRPRYARPIRFLLSRLIEAQRFSRELVEALPGTLTDVAAPASPRKRGRRSAGRAAQAPAPTR